MVGGVTLTPEEYLRHQFLEMYKNNPEIFDNYTSTTLVLPGAGPGNYYLQTISGNGAYSSEIREITVGEAFPDDLTASNNGSVEIDGVLALAVGYAPAGTTYSWTGPSTESSIYTATGRNLARPNFTEDMAGVYTLSIATASTCSFTSTTEVSVANCDIYIESKDAAEEETYKLTRVAGQPGVYEPLMLTVLPYVGSSTFSAYDIQWMLNGSPIDYATTSHTIQATEPGDYAAILSLKINPSNICETEIHLAGTPCNELVPMGETCQSVTIDLPDALSDGVALGVGDEFTAADYTVVVTEISSGSPSGWYGKGYVAMRLINGITAAKIAITFEDAVINECYELAGGTVLTEYDPSWGGVADVDEVANSIVNGIREFKDLKQDLIDRMEVIDCSQASMDAFNTDLTILTSFNTSTIPNFNLNNEEKNEMSALVSDIANTFTCKVQGTCSNNNARLNGSSDESNCDYDEISDKSEQLYEMLDEAEAKTFIKYTVGFPAPSAAKPLNDQSLSYGNFGSLGRANNNPSDENWQSGTESSPIKPQKEIAKIEYAKEITNIAYPDVPYYEGQRRDLEAEVLETSICPAEVTDAQLIQKMSFPFTLVGGVSKYWNLPENYPELIFNRFLENSREDYHTDAQVAKLVFESTKGKNMLKGIVTYFHKTIKDKGLGYENSFGFETRNEHNVILPNFITDGYGVLFSLMGGTQEIRVLVKELNLNGTNYEAVLVVQLMDIFGADEDDWAEKFNIRSNDFNWKISLANDLLSNDAKQSLVAFYALQKQRGYQPFRVINTFTITLNNVSLNAIPD